MNTDHICFRKPITKLIRISTRYLPIKIENSILGTGLLGSDQSWLALVTDVHQLASTIHDSFMNGVYM